MTIADIKATYKEHHTSMTRGYVSRKNTDGIAIPYSGRFGTGYKILTPCFCSTQYCYVTYYTECFGN